MCGLRYDRNQSRAVPQIENLESSLLSSRQVKQKENNIVMIINFQKTVIVNASKGGEGSLGDVQPQLSR